MTLTLATPDKICHKNLTITVYKEFRTSMYNLWNFKICGTLENGSEFEIISENEPLAESILRTMGLAVDYKRASTGILEAKNLLANKPLVGKIVRRKARAYVYYEFYPARAAQGTRR